MSGPEPIRSPIRSNGELGERPADILDGVAGDAWQAYNAMETTKQRHFELLELLDSKKRNYNIDPTAMDKQLLEFLLADHDSQVKRFTAATTTLKQQDLAAHTALFAYIGAINQAASDRKITH